MGPSIQDFGICGFLLNTPKKKDKTKEEIYMPAALNLYPQGIRANNQADAPRQASEKNIYVWYISNLLKAFSKYICI